MAVTTSVGALEQQPRPVVWLVNHFPTAILATWGFAWLIMWLGRLEWSWLPVYEPAVVALSLGLIALFLFAGIYYRETENGMRTAIAGTFVIVFLLLVIDLLTIREFREALSDVGDVKVTVSTKDGISITSDAAAEACGTTGATGATGTSGTQAGQKGTPSGNTDAAAEACVPAPAVAISLVEGLFGTFKWVITAIIIFYFTAAAATEVVDKVQEGKTKRQGNEIAAQDRAAGRTPPAGS